MRGWQKSAVLACGLLAAWPSIAQTPKHPIDTRPEGNGAQCSYTGTASSGQGNTMTTSSNTCGQQTATPANPSASQYAFPGESEVPKVNDDGTLSPAQAAAQDAPTPQGSSSSSSSSDAPGLKDAGSSGSSSSRSSSSSSSQPDGDASSSGDGTPPGDAAPAPKRGRKKLPPVPRQTPDERETEDVQVGLFYMNDNNYVAAYARAKDAISIADDDWEAHLLLADAARKMGRLDEAQTQYKRTLALDPTPKGKKAAEAALKQMDGTGSGDTIMP